MTAGKLYHSPVETVLDEPVGLVPNSAYFGTSSDPLLSRVGQERPRGRVES
jgi:hypothetical protein